MPCPPQIAPPRRCFAAKSCSACSLPAALLRLRNTRRSQTCPRKYGWAQPPPLSSLHTTPAQQRLRCRALRVDMVPKGSAHSPLPTKLKKRPCLMHMACTRSDAAVACHSKAPSRHGNCSKFIVAVAAHAGHHRTCAPPAHIAGCQAQCMHGVSRRVPNARACSAQLMPARAATASAC